MNNQLIQTICYGAPYGLQVQYKNGHIYTINPEHYGSDHTNKTIGINSAIKDAENKHAKLLLHSTSKLTEPVLDGGKVPIVELFKICMKNNYYPKDFFKKEKPIFYIEDDAVNLKIGAFIFGYDLLDSSFVLVLEDCNLTVFNQLELFNFMFENHFNLFNLSEEYFTEKSTLKN